MLYITYIRSFFFFFFFGLSYCRAPFRTMEEFKNVRAALVKGAMDVINVFYSELFPVKAKTEPNTDEVDLEGKLKEHVSQVCCLWVLVLD